MSHFTVPAVTPADQEAFGKQALAHVASINWNELDSEQVNVLGRAVNLLLDQPEHLWQAFEFYRGLFTSEHKFESLGLMLEGKVPSRVRDNWLAIHGVELHDRNQYKLIEGENGFARYREEFTALNAAMESVPGARELDKLAIRHPDTYKYTEFEHRLYSAYQIEIGS